MSAAVDQCRPMASEPAGKHVFGAFTNSEVAQQAVLGVVALINDLLEFLDPPDLSSQQTV